MHRFYKIVSKIDYYLKEYSDNNLASIEKLFLEGVGLKEYFLHSLSSHENPFSWFEKLFEKGYFSIDKIPNQYEDKRKDGTFIIAPYWPAIGIFTNVIDKLKLKDKKGIIDKINSVILEIIDARINEKYKNYRLDYFIPNLISELPAKFISQIHFNYLILCIQNDKSIASISIEEKMLPKLIEEKSKEQILDLLRLIVFNYNNDAGSPLNKFRPFIEDYTLRQIVEKYTDSIIEICGVDAIELSISVVRDISNKLPSSFSVFDISSIDGDKDHMYDDSGYFPLVNFIAKSLSTNFISDTIREKIVKEIINSETPILRRIGFFIIDKNYEKLGTLLWELKYNPVDSASKNYEFFEALKHNADKLSESQVDIYIAWIERMDLSYYDSLAKDTPEEIIEKQKALRNRVMLEIIIENSQLKLHELIKKYNKLNNADYDQELELKGYKFGGVKSNIIDRESHLKFKDWSVDAIVDYLNDEQEINSHGFNNKEGVGEDLRQDIVENPTKHICDIHLYKKLKSNYWYSFLVAGFSHSYEKKPEINIKPVLEFIFYQISSDKTLIESNTPEKRNLLLPYLLSFLDKGTHDDALGFNNENLGLAEEIAILVFNETEYGDLENGKTTDFFDPSHKLSFSRVLIMLSLKRGRTIVDKEAKVKWIPEIKELFTKELNEEKSKEFFFLMGAFLPNLYYLDRKWTEENLDKIFNLSKKEFWKSAFGGYLIHSRTVYKPIFLDFVDRGFYNQALETRWEKDFERKKLIEHIATGYKQRMDSFDKSNSLIKKVVYSDNPALISELLMHFVIPRIEKNYEHELIRDLWRNIYKSIKDKVEFDIEFQKIASSLSHFMMQIGEIDSEAFDWIKMTAKYVNQYFKIYDFIKALLSHCITTSKFTECGKLFLEIINNDSFPTYKSEEIIKFVELMYQNNETEIANEICNKYGENGVYFLKNTYFKYNVPLEKI